MSAESVAPTVVNADEIPADLRDRPQWVLWRWMERDGKWTKPPFRPDGTFADSSDRSTWVPFSEALAAYQAGNFDGIGYVTTTEDGIAGVDLDHCRDTETGDIDSWALAIVQRLDSYTEVSPSGTGLRIFLQAKLPPQDRKLGNFECYEQGRYLTVTGQHLDGTPTAIESRQVEMEAVHAEVFAERRRRRKTQAAPTPSNPVDLGDGEVLRRAFTAKNGDAVRALFHGDTSAYGGDHSAADLALCSHLAFWAGGEPGRIDRLFRASALIRPKWDEPRGTQTYGERTIALALEGAVDVYSPPAPNDVPMKSVAIIDPLMPWEPPLPFQERPAPPFPSDALPGVVRDFVEAEAEAFQVPVALPGVLVLASSGAAGAGRAVVRLAPDWTEPLNLYVAVVLPSGERKSPVFREVTRPLEDRERELSEAAKLDIGQAQAEHDVLEKMLQAAKAEAAKAKDETRKAAMEKVASLASGLAAHEVPCLPRLLADDITAEAVASLLAEQGQIAVMSAEGGIFETIAGRYSQGVPNLDVYLKGFSGDTLRVDRKTRPPEYVRKPALTMALTVQPAVIQDLAVKPGFRGRGLLARVLYALPQSLVGYRSLDVPAVPGELRRAWDETVRAMLKLPLPPPDQDERELVLSREGLEYFGEFRAEVEVALRPGGDLDGIQDWGNKLPGAVARIAGILHLCQYASQGEAWSKPVSLDTVKAAVRLGRYFTDHAKAAFAMMGADPAISNAQHVLAWIMRETRDSFTQSEVWRATRGRFHKVGPLNAALHTLEEHGFIRREVHRQEGGGRPETRFSVNPFIDSQNGHNGHNSAPNGNSGHFSHSGQPGADHEQKEEETEWRG